MGLHADLGAAISSALATATGVQSEYGHVPTRGGNESYCLVKPGTVARLRRFEDTARSRFDFTVRLEVFDRSDPHTTVTGILEGIADITEIASTTVFAALTDSGSNVKASTIDCRFGEPDVDMSTRGIEGRHDGDPDRPLISFTASVECWHSHPLA